MDVVSEEVPLERTLRRLIGPMLLSLALMGSVGLVDMLFVSMLGGHAMAALSFAIPVMMLVGQVSIGLGIGMTSVVARAQGGGDTERAKRLARHGMWLALVAALVFTAGFLGGLDALFGMLGAQSDMRPAIVEFMTWWLPCLGAFFVMGWGTAVLRGLGETRTSALAWMLQSVVNLVLDPLFIFGLGPLPGLGLPGAALATTVGALCSAVLVLYFLRHRGFLSVLPLELSVLGESTRHILAVALPAILTYSLVPLIGAVIVWMLAAFGPAAVAGYGVVVRVEGFVVMLPMAIGGGLGPLVGQHWGSGNMDLIRRATGWCRLRAAGAGVLVALGLAILAVPLGPILGDDPQTAAMTTAALAIVPWGFGSYGAIVVTSAVYNNIGRAVRGAQLAAIRMLILTLPMALIAREFFGPYGVYAALPIASVITERVATFWLRRDELIGTSPAIATSPG